MRRLSISDSNVRDIKVFFLVTFIITVLCVSVFEFVLLRIGETLPYDEVVRQQQANKELYYSPRYFNVGSLYKIYGVKYNKPEVIALGTSRIMPMDQRHIGGLRFYNAAIDASTSREIGGMLKILQSLDSQTMPNCVVLGIDPWLFNPNYPANRMDWKNRTGNYAEHNIVSARIYSVYKFVSQRLKSYDMLVSDRSPWLKYLFVGPEKDRIGLNALMAKGGFLSDGSFHYPDSYEADGVKALPEWQEWLAKDQYRFPAAYDIDRNALGSFKNFLEFCRNKKIKVVGVLLPFRGDFYSALISMRSHAEFFEKFQQTIPAVMSEFGYKCYDFSSPEAMDLTADDFWDNLHLKEVSFGKILKQIPDEFHVEVMVNAAL